MNTPVDETLWQGECFVFDERVTVNETLGKGIGPDFSLRHKHLPVRCIKDE